MDFNSKAVGDYEGYAKHYYSGRRPNGTYIPRFRNLDEKTRRKDYIRGFGYQGSGTRLGWDRGESMEGVGPLFKAGLTAPGPWHMWLGGWGECLPYRENRATLNRNRLDKWGQATLNLDCSLRENEEAMRIDMKDSAAEMLEAAGMKNIKTFDYGSTPGLCNHETGTARMGRDPKTSVLNEFNQMHEVRNVFVTDGSCMASGGCQNPSLTYMALTARACHYAVNELKRISYHPQSGWYDEGPPEGPFRLM
jgi:choline dehydrogenase-like flavoprotein